MKVLIVAEQLRRSVPGGIGTYVRGLVQGLATTSADVTAYASPSSGGADAVDALGIASVTAKLPSKLLTRAWDAGWYRPPAGFDVVHATSMALPPAGSAPMTAMIHDLAWRSFPEAFPPRGRRWHEAALRRTINRAGTLFVPSVRTADDLCSDGVAGERVVVVDEGCDHLPKPDHIEADRRLQELEITGDFFLAVGTLEPRKNLITLVKAYEQARRALDEPVPLLVVGPHGWGGRFEPPPGVFTLGSAGPALIAALYEKCRLFVSVPLLEGYGLPALEAMHLGAPVITSPVPSAGDAALLVDPHNVGEIADALVTVSTDDEIRADLIERGRRHASTRTWAASAAVHVAVWEGL